VAEWHLVRRPPHPPDGAGPVGEAEQPCDCSAPFVAGAFPTRRLEASDGPSVWTRGTASRLRLRFGAKPNKALDAVGQLRINLAVALLKLGE
jgi:hypothetical protein